MVWTNPASHAYADGETVGAATLNSVVEANLVAVGTGPGVFWQGRVMGGGPPISFPGAFQMQFWHAAYTTDGFGQGNLFCPTPFATNMAEINAHPWMNGGPRPWYLCYGTAAWSRFGVGAVLWNSGLNTGVASTVVTYVAYASGF